MASSSFTPIDPSKLTYHKAPPLDPAWVAYDRTYTPPEVHPSEAHLEAGPARYAAECRAHDAKLMAPGAAFERLATGIERISAKVRSSLDAEYEIDLLKYQLEGDDGKREPEYVVFYIHGGGLYVGEADSEDLACRMILKDSQLPGSKLLYSTGYRLLPQVKASTCLQDVTDTFTHVCKLHPSAKIIVVGSSSGGHLAAWLSQTPLKAEMQGVVLRAPVTSDAYRGEKYVPKQLRQYHTSAREESFITSMLGFMIRDEPRDGAERMPLEAREEDLEGMPRTFVQCSTNDTLYSDGWCYAKLLEDAGVEVRLDVVVGWPHTFWLRGPELPRAMEADRVMLEGLAWVAGSSKQA